MLRCIFVSVLLLAMTFTGVAQDRSYGRSMVITDRGIVATSQYLASQAGAQILARGGSAIDAAIAANAVLGVTEPMMNGMGGDLFLIYRDAKTGKLYGLNSSGWAPKGLSIAYLKARDVTAMPEHGIDSVTVPGAVEGWSEAHQRFGKLPWKELFEPAIYYADHGYPVAELVHGYWQRGAPVFQNDEAKRVFLQEGKVPEVGQVFTNKDVAQALRLVADGGADAFYRGAIAQAILKTSADAGGTMKADDLAEFKAEWVDPISIDYRGWRVYELPPNGQGMAALEMLNILSNFQPDPSGPEGAVELHKKIEAMKLAYSDLYRYNADPRFAKVPTQGLISKEYAAERAKLINLDKANCNVEAGKPPSSDTTYLSVVDKDGNIVSLIQSNYDYFGSGIAVEGMGFFLQDRGALFRLDPSHPDALAPRKRPFHTIIPAFMEKGDIHIGFGIMGGANQPVAHAQFVSDVVDYNMNIQAALSAPRFTVHGSKVDCGVPIESRVKPEVMQQLRQKGHDLIVVGDYSSAMGRGQAVIYNSKTGMKYGASDPRADGNAEPEPLPASAMQ
jgi:gamma-glutamyltranspeptidase/glutathione hydrolase